MLNRFFHRSILALAVTLLLAAAPAAGQEDAAQDAPPYPHIGIGVSISDASTAFSQLFSGAISDSFAPIPTLLVPIDVNESFRIEPVVGYTRLKNTQKLEGGGNSEENSTTTTILRLGAGVFGRSLRGDAMLYYGARVGYNRLSQSSDDDDEDSEALDGIFVGPTVGGSYFFSDFFSLGGEVEARYTRFSEGDEEGDFSATVTNTTIALRPSLVVRFYF